MLEAWKKVDDQKVDDQSHIQSVSSIFRLFVFLTVSIIHLGHIKLYIKRPNSLRVRKLDVKTWTSHSTQLNAPSPLFVRQFILCQEICYYLHNFQTAFVSCNQTLANGSSSQLRGYYSEPFFWNILCVRIYSGNNYQELGPEWINNTKYIPIPLGNGCFKIAVDILQEKSNRSEPWNFQLTQGKNS